MHAPLEPVSLNRVKKTEKEARRKSDVWITSPLTASIPSSPSPIQFIDKENYIVATGKKKKKKSHLAFHRSNHRSLHFDKNPLSDLNGKKSSYVHFSRPGDVKVTVTGAIGSSPKREKKEEKEKKKGRRYTIGKEKSEGKDDRSRIILRSMTNLYIYIKRVFVEFFWIDFWRW